MRAGLRDHVPVLLLLLPATALALWPSLDGAFVWDDLKNFVLNPHYRGLGPAQLRWMLTTAHAGHYIPVSWMSLALDYRLWGMAPRGYHLTNLVLHLAAVLLFHAVARRLLRAAAGLEGRSLAVGAGAAAAFFALHPLRAESVAWVTERRDVLSGVFLLATILLHLRAVEATGARRCRRLAAAAGAYLLALGSKSIVMTLPATLLLLDAYPLRRLAGGPREWLRRPPWPLLREKLPYAALALGTALVARQVQVVVTELGTYPWPTRIVVGVYGLWFYLLKTAVPLGLGPLYEVPRPFDPWEPRFVAAMVGVPAVTAGVLLLRRRWPAGLALWAYHVIAFSPVLGLVVRAGFQLAADRYTYLGSLGWALLVGGAAGRLVRARQRGLVRPRRAALAGALLLGWLLALGGLLWRQSHVWRDEATLWARGVAVDPRCAICQSNLGSALLARGRPAEALGHLQAALALRPDRIWTHEAAGLALAALGRWAEAEAALRHVVSGVPDALDARGQLAAVLLAQGRSAEALGELEVLRPRRPEDPVVRANLGVALLQLGRPREAAEALAEAIRLGRDDGRTRLLLAQAYLALGDVARAREQHALLRVRAPDLARALEGLLPPAPEAGGGGTVRP